MTQVKYNRQPLDYKTATRPEFAGEVDYWKIYAQRADERAQRAEEKIEELADELQWRDDIIANKQLQGNMKAYLIGLHRAIQKSRAREYDERDGKIHVYREDIAEYGGFSVDTATSQGMTADANGLIMREVRGSKEEDGFGKDVYIALSKQVYKNPAGIAITTVRNGGKRVAECVHCHSTEFIKKKKRVTFICTNPTCTHCGVEVSKDEIVMVSEEQLATEQAMREEEAARPTSLAPERDCFHCTYRYGKPVRAWKWDLRAGVWICANQAEHELPKIEQIGEPGCAG